MIIIRDMPDVSPQRIISLVPSITELLFDLGLKNRIVGITSFCVHPPEAIKQKTLIGGIFKLKFDIIEKLKPDLIIASKEENNKEEILRLKKKYNVLLFDVKSFDDALDMVQSIGKHTGKENESKEIISSIKIGFSELISLQSKLSIACLIWKKPFITLSGNTYISDIINKLGFKNIYSNHKKLYPEISLEQLKKDSPDILFLLSEPCYFDNKDRIYFSSQLPSTKVILVDGEMFAWYGSRMIKAAEYFRGFLKIV